MITSMDSESNERLLQNEALEEAASREWKLDAKLARAVEYIKANLPIDGFQKLIGEAYWMRHLMQDIERGTPQSRSAALKMMGEHLGLLGKKNKSSFNKHITIEEED